MRTFDVAKVVTDASPNNAYDICPDRFRLSSVVK